MTAAATPTALWVAGIVALVAAAILCGLFAVEYGGNFALFRRESDGWMAAALLGAALLLAATAGVML